ncbi:MULTISPECIES: DUF4232 domain-containing protein [unclassified Streptomyces]|uniref:DUF4232 domain-containing protein n=1 Tax=unclassified Streptomyces TaxID=2593676 RepID=UPI0008897729|nr:MULTISPECIES: DUF4232 domain-containing protein [unclassified Streptomyces]PBC80888.1 uncharacterized protein DUF4232 [Streptomyces sp. 2321.6]SDR56986.1 Protein of unknown function [Streptomyces sp. KS_16]SEB92621.1 Protein of unknown function [Streptomyces sp. 2133.1]SEF12127.1 Protein of unknown function [Streptomyces sp. 2112.3]SNC62655.1 Protein of unknown function [Streptomyces sp. 2114.4]
MNRTYTARIRRVALTAAAGVALAVTVTACGKDGGSGSASAGDAAASAKATAESSSGASQEGSGSGKKAGSSSNGDTSAKDGSSSSDSKPGPSGDKKGYGQSCGANDLKFSARSETQAGGYILLSARAKPGITCTIPSGLPSVSFGSKGIEAHPAEQAVGPAITLSGSKTAYAGVNPKTTNNNDGVEFTFLIAAIGASDPNPASVSTGSVTVDRPIVTNWHTTPADAVPGDGTDN